jgi:hypothetical protein
MRAETVDVLLVRTGTTAGLRRDDDELRRALEALGLSVANASSDYGLLGHLRVAFPFIDLIEALALRRAVARALRRTGARAIIFSTAISPLFQPASVLRRSAIRFDATPDHNRLGWRNAPTRWLSRRSLKRAALLLPFTSEQATDFPGDPRVHVLTSPIPPGPAHTASRERAALCYAGNPGKKGLDLAVAAWATAAPATLPLYVTGIEAESGREFLRRRGLSAGENIVWCGRLEPAAHRELSARVELYIAAARQEEWGGVQREALMDGALLVTVPSAGPIALLDMARGLDRALVASEISAPALATCIVRAFEMNTDARVAYRVRAAEMMASYTRANFEQVLSEKVLPGLFGATPMRNSLSSASR